MGLTKRRFSKARTASRRAHFRVQPVTLVECPQCHARTCSVRRKVGADGVAHQLIRCWLCGYQRRVKSVL